MPKILYTVRTTCPNVQVRGRYLAWLVPDHVLAVKAAGATDVRVVLPEVAPGGEAPVEVQYVFASRRALDDYLRDAAPALRADGARRFPPESGVVSTRQVAEIAAELND